MLFSVEVLPLVANSASSLENTSPQAICMSALPSKVPVAVVSSLRRGLAKHRENHR